MSTLSRPTRRDLMVLGAASGLSAAMTPLFATSARAGGTINFADIGVGDPSGDWSLYSKESGFNVNLVAIGNRRRLS